VSPNDPLELAARISQLLDNPHRARAMGARGRSRVVSQFGQDRARATMRQALALD
jgi:phosphatidylinositol alpha-1,6-mannosyltransferase